MMYGNIWSAQRIIAKHHMTLDQLAALSDNEILEFRQMYSDCQSRSTKNRWENGGDECKNKQVSLRKTGGRLQMKRKRKLLLINN